MKLQGNFIVGNYTTVADYGSNLVSHPPPHLDRTFQASTKKKPDKIQEVLKALNDHFTTQEFG